MTNSASADPFTTLGVPREASEAEIRARYLELVKTFPPEREPERFREIRAAFEAARDPLVIARRLLEPPGEEVPKWADAIERHKKIPPPLTPSFLLSLGNRDRGAEGRGRKSGVGEPEVGESEVGGSEIRGRKSEGRER